MSRYVPPSYRKARKENNMQKELKILSKLYQCRDTAKRFYRDEYKDKIHPYKECIKKYMIKSGKNELLSVMEICEIDEIKEKGGFAIVMFMAAAVELIEPSV